MFLMCSVNSSRIDQIIERAKVYFDVGTVMLLLIQFSVYSIIVRPYVGSIIDPHALTSGYFALSDDAMLWIAVVSLSIAIVVYSALLLFDRWDTQKRSKDVSFTRLALVNVVMALGQLMVVLNYKL